MSLSLRVSWTAVVAALMLLAVLGSARAQEPEQRHIVASADVVDVVNCQWYSATRH